MSSEVCIVRTEFKNITDGEVSYCFRLFDDYEAMYSNLYGPEIKDMSDMDLLREASQLCSEKDSEMLVSLCDNEDGIDIDGTYYEWDEIMSILE